VRRTIVLHSVRGDLSQLDDMVRGWIAENVAAICVVGQDSDSLHFQIDLLLSDHELSTRGADHIEITSHDGETLEDVIAFARENGAGEPAIVEL
jgi:hypothetical protein